jgi:hypothetical protein
MQSEIIEIRFRKIEERLYQLERKLRNVVQTKEAI